MAEAPNPWDLARESWSLAATYARSAGEGWLTGSETVLRRWTQWWRELAEQPQQAPLFTWQQTGHRLAFWQETRWNAEGSYQS